MKVGNLIFRNYSSAAVLLFLKINWRSATYRFLYSEAYLYHNYRHHNMAMRWYCKQDIDNDHVHERVEHCVRKKDIAAYLKLRRVNEKTKGEV